MMLEKTVKAAVRKRLKELGAYQHWPVMLGLGAACLDCHGCYQGQYFGIETKAPGKKPTLRQKITIKTIQSAGGDVFVIDNVEDAKEIYGKKLPNARMEIEKSGESAGTLEETKRKTHSKRQKRGSSKELSDKK